MTIVEKSDDQAVFGPVPSRRLGMSLGVDLLWPKTCSLDCVYCECGPTTVHTATRQRFRDPEEVLRQVRERLAELDTPAGLPDPGRQRRADVACRHGLYPPKAARA